MKKLAKWWVTFRDEYEHLAFITNEILHNRWPEPDVLVPARVRDVDGAKRSCSRADMSAAAILEFVKAQKKPTTLFDEYIATEKRREVMTDE